MATLEELKEKVLADEALLAEFKKTAETTEGLRAFLAEQGCDATAEEALAFAKGSTGELADDELDDVAGGCGVEKIDCVLTVCPACGSTNIQNIVMTAAEHAKCRDCGHQWDVRFD